MKFYKLGIFGIFFFTQLVFADQAKPDLVPVNSAIDLNQISNIAVAFGTLLAVIVALFGDWIRSRLFSPKLKLSLLNKEGIKSPVTLSWQDSNGVPHSREGIARYYHLKLRNKVRWPVATNTQVFLKRIEELGPDREYHITWSSDIPMNWRHQEIFPVARTFGPDADCDLASVVEEKWLELHTLIKPLVLKARYREPVDIIVTLQAKSEQGESNILRINLAWDGKWSEDEKEMMRHLVVKELK